MNKQKILEKDIEFILKDTSDCAENCFTYHKPCICNQCEAKRITDFILKREEKVRKEERKETAYAILSAWKQISRSYDSGETQKKSFERIDRLAKFYDTEVEG